MKTLEELQKENEEYRNLLIELRDTYTKFGLIGGIMSKVINILEPHRKTRH